MYLKKEKKIMNSVKSPYNTAHNRNENIAQMKIILENILNKSFQFQLKCGQ